MKQEAFRRELIDLTPDVPEMFHRRVEAFLAEKVDQEVNMKEETKIMLRTGRRIGSRVLAIALAVMLLLGTAAFAAARWGIFDTLSVILGPQPPTADSVMQGNLHQEVVNGVEISIREAGYDGRTLFLQYSYRMLDASEPVGTIGKHGERMLKDTDIARLDAYGVGNWLDAFWINGQEMDMASNSGGQMRGSEVPGEIVVTEYWRLDNLGVTLSDEVEIALPIGEKPSSEYRHSLFSKEAGQWQLPDRGVVTFKLDVSDVLSRVVTLHPCVDTVTPDVTVRVTEAAFTPLMTYITLAMEENPDSVAAYKAELGEGFFDSNGNLLWEYSGMYVYGDWIAELQLVDGEGNVMFPDHWGSNGYNSTWAEFTYPYLDASKLPEELWLAPVEDDVADMTCAIRVK